MENEAEEKTSYFQAKVCENAGATLIYIPKEIRNVLDLKLDDQVRIRISKR